MVPPDLHSTGFSCRCGAVTGHIRDLSPKTGTRVVCHCEDCARALRHYGFPADRDTGVDLIQTTPERVIFTSGLSQLGVARLSPKGLLRWYAKCCDTPMFNTLPRPGFPFATLHTACAKDLAAIGPVTAHVNRTGADDKPANQNLFGAVLAMVGRAARSRMTGAWKSTPFFDMATRAPVVEPVILPKAAGRAS